MDAAQLQAAHAGTLAETLGIRFVEASKDRVVAELEHRPPLTTVGGALHGGTLMAFADTIGAAATFLNLPAGATPPRSSRRPTSSRPAAPASCAPRRRRSIAAGARWCGRRASRTPAVACSR